MWVGPPTERCEQERGKDGAHEAVVIPHYARSPADDDVSESDLPVEECRARGS